MRKRAGIYLFFMLVGLVFGALTGNSLAADIQVRAAVDSRDVFVGEAVNFQIQVEGHDSPPEPDLSQVKNFRVQFRGGQQNSSTSITSINGKWSKVTKRAYIFNYLITPLKAGQLTFPAVTLTIDGRTYQTRPFTINARRPEESDDFKLRQRLSKERCYVGEPLVLTTTWYIGRDVKSFDFNLPLLDDPRFTVYSREPEQLPPDPDDRFEFAAGPEKIVAVRGSGRLEGKSFTTLTFEQTIIPRQSGDFTLPQATVSCQALSGYSRRKSRSFGAFDDPFFSDFFGSGRQGVYRTQVIPANEPELRVMELPAAGRPDDFSGLVGVYEISTQAAPVEVNVGDPITLTIKISGPFVDNVRPPSLAGLERSGFKIPGEISSGVKEDNSKIFTQTIRARSADIREIPALELSFFNTATGRYETSRSQPIALTVHPTRIVTARDAEGAAEQLIKKKIKSSSGGINFNYDGPEVLLDQQPDKLSGNTIIMLLAGPPAAFLLLLGLSFFLRRGRDPEKARARKAAAHFYEELERLEQSGGPAELAQALKTYLGLKLRRPAAALTFLDIKPQLEDGGISPETLDSLRHILEQGEAARYAGGAVSAEEMRKLLDQARQTVSELEKRLGK